mgnify:CR=1 FL=1
MRNITLIALWLAIGATLTACVPLPPEEAQAYPPPVPSVYPPPVTSSATHDAYPLPTVTGTLPAGTTRAPTNTPFPMPVGPAPEKTFTEVGSVARLAGSHGVSGKAVVAGLQRLIILRFNFDGKGPKADIRLVKGENYAEPAAVLYELEQRAYHDEVIGVVIPSSAGPDSADSIAVYAPGTGEVYAVAKFGF